MIQMNEYELSKVVIMLIGEDLKIKKKINESNDDYIDRIIEQLRVSVGEDDPCKLCRGTI